MDRVVYLSDFSFLSSQLSVFVLFLFFGYD